MFCAEPAKSANSPHCWVRLSITKKLRRSLASLKTTFSSGEAKWKMGEYVVTHSKAFRGFKSFRSEDCPVCGYYGSCGQPNSLRVCSTEGWRKLSHFPGILKMFRRMPCGRMLLPAVSMNRKNS